MNYKKKNWGGLNDIDQKTWQEIYADYVPTFGMCDTIGGEMMRCMDRLVFRFYNDGDKVCRYGGGIKNILKGANTFLLEMSDRYGFEYHDLDGIYTDERYSEILDGNLKYLFIFVVNNSKVFKQRNTIDTCEVGCPEEYDDNPYIEEEDY